MIKIAITGGIGSGKSLISRIVGSMGFPVYDCDSRARRLIDSDSEIKKQISALVGPDAIGTDGSLNRKVVAEAVFADPDKLNGLNRLTHSAVRKDIRQWISRQDSQMVFIETAILKESNIHAMVDRVWWIEAPLEVRKNRVMMARNMTGEDFLNRARMQTDEPFTDADVILNDGFKPVLPQVESLLGR